MSGHTTSVLLQARLRKLSCGVPRFLIASKNGTQISRVKALANGKPEMSSWVYRISLISI